MEQLAVLQFRTGADFAANLETLSTLFEKAGAWITLTGFAYDRMDEADRFGKEALNALMKKTDKRILVMTVIEKRVDGFYNVAKVLHCGTIVYEQAKHKLFLLGEEERYFQKGPDTAIGPFEIDGVRLAILICFELRFPKLWQQVEGAEVILIPAMWGKNRASHLKILSQALAVANRAFVMVSDSANGDMAKESAVITPWGERYADNTAQTVTARFNPKEITKIKRAIPYE